MKGLTVLLLLASASAAADPQVGGGSRLRNHVEPWWIRTVLPNGQMEKFGEWATRKECEAHIKEVEVRNSSYGSECVDITQKPPPAPAK